MATPRAKTVSLSEIADVFGVSTETIRLWRKAGMPSRIQSGKPAFVVSECVKWRREADRADATPDGDQAKQDRLRILRAEAELKELELQERSGLLVRRADFEQEIEAFIGGFVGAVSGRLQQFEREIVQAATPQAARALTERIQDECLRGAREYADELETREDDEDPPPASEAAA